MVVDLGELEPGLKRLRAEIDTNLGQLERVFVVLALNEGLCLFEQQWHQIRIRLDLVG